MVVIFSEQMLNVRCVCRKFSFDHVRDETNQTVASNSGATWRQTQELGLADIRGNKIGSTLGHRLWQFIFKRSSRTTWTIGAGSRWCSGSTEARWVSAWWGQEGAGIRI